MIHENSATLHQFTINVWLEPLFPAFFCAIKEVRCNYPVHDRASSRLLCSTWSKFLLFYWRYGLVEWKFLHNIYRPFRHRESVGMHMTDRRQFTVWRLISNEQRTNDNWRITIRVLTE